MNPQAHQEEAMSQVSGQLHPGPAGAAGGDLRALASDADRDRTAELLSTAFTEGRLTADEHSERVRAASAARTWQQLHALTADLPVPAADVTTRAAPGIIAGPDLALLSVLVVVFPPAGLAWLLLAWHHSRTHPGQPLT
jgi:hypothetical protein